MPGTSAHVISVCRRISLTDMEAELLQQLLSSNLPCGVVDLSLLTHSGRRVSLRPFNEFSRGTNVAAAGAPS
jgi:hypothetical protein